MFGVAAPIYNLHFYPLAGFPGPSLGTNPLLLKLCDQKSVLAVSNSILSIIVYQKINQGNASTRCNQMSQEIWPSHSHRSGCTRISGHGCMERHLWRFGWQRRDVERQGLLHSDGFGELNIILPIWHSMGSSAVCFLVGSRRKH